MPSTHEQPGAVPAQPFRLDVPLHDLLTGAPAPESSHILPGAQGGKAVSLPNPVFPQHPELLSLDDNYEEMLERGEIKWQ